jgi:hypothetical protein
MLPPTLRKLFFGLMLLVCVATAQASPRKVHVVLLGSVRHVPYSAIGDPAGANATEKDLKIRSLLVDGVIKETTTGESHDVTDRSFAIRRAIRLNDSLPRDKVAKWVWQRGPWLLVDRQTGHITALHLPDYDPLVSNPVWFRDYTAYCGLTASGKQLYAVVAQVGARKPLLAKKLGGFDPADHATPVCAPSLWQREPLRVTFQVGKTPPVSFDLIGSSAVLVEDSEDADDAAR